MNIIITGASSGIGYFTALSLAQSGNHHIVAIARNLENLKYLQQEAKATQSTITIIAFDLNNGNIEQLSNEIAQIFNGNPIDILINNAGHLINKPFENLEQIDWQEIFQTNVFVPAQLIRSLLKYFDEKNGGHIVNIGSMGGVQGSQKFEGLSAYSASKGAINILTESLAVELQKYNISVNAINPGAVQTPMLEKAFPGYNALIKPEKIGEFIADFALKNGKLMNGKMIEVSLTR